MGEPRLYMRVGVALAKRKRPPFPEAALLRALRSLTLRSVPVLATAAELESDLNTVIASMVGKISAYAERFGMGADTHQCRRV